MGKPLRNRYYEFFPQQESVSAKKLILLIHGIRTRAEWQSMVKQILEEGGSTVIPIKYGYFDAFRFWFPFLTRRAIIDQICQRIEDAIANYASPNSELVIIAHSFGTYAISQILEEKSLIRPKRMILCGSIIPADFRWNKLSNRPEVINECGNRDIWPLLAQSSTWGYGDSGVFGFDIDTPAVHNRFHNLGHSDYFSEEFVKKFWYSWIYDLKNVSSDERNQAKTSWWRSILPYLPINWLIVVVLFCIFISINIQSN